MMDDLISRQEAIDNMARAIWGYPNEIYPQLNDYNMALALAKDGLMGVPSAQQWIPCSERLPFFYEDVLVCNDDWNIGVAKRTKTSIHPNNWAINYCLYDSDSWDDEENGVIVAWMPLPEPHKGEEE